MNTQASYGSTLNQIKGVDTLTKEGLWNVVESNGKSNDEKRRIQYIIKGYLKIIKGYLKYNKLPFDIFEKNLKKVEMNGKYIHTCDKVEEPVIAQVKKKGNWNK